MKPLDLVDFGAPLGIDYFNPTRPEKCNRLYILGIAMCLTLLPAGCGGGGSGGGDSRRTEKTAIRVIHGSVDGTPVQVAVPLGVVQKARFAEVTTYVPVEKGEQVVTVDRANSSGVRVAQFSTLLEDKTEYTVFVSGEARTGDLSAQLFSDPVERPESGFARLRLYHALEGEGALTLRASELSAPGIRRGQRSDSLDVPAGPQTIDVVDSRGTVISSLAVELEERSEVAVLLAGNAGLEVVFTKLYTDFD
ncbi:MAG: DUF4397 domain-containing protein [Bdellovibrionales bacterium]|nr:DUF4397 domain-containing protein [Bdellovibrionales bacterium]